MSECVEYMDEPVRIEREGQEIRVKADEMYGQEAARLTHSEARAVAAALIKAADDADREVTVVYPIVREPDPEKRKQSIDAVFGSEDA